MRNIFLHNCVWASAVETVSLSSKINLLDSRTISLGRGIDPLGSGIMQLDSEITWLDSKMISLDRGMIQLGSGMILLGREIVQLVVGMISTSSERENFNRSVIFSPTIQETLTNFAKRCENILNQQTSNLFPAYNYNNT
jgi:hypothetical protein